MTAIVAYLKFLSSGRPVGAPTIGRGPGRMPELTRAADPVMRQIAAIQDTVRKKLLRNISPEHLGVSMSVFAAILANMDLP